MGFQALDVLMLFHTHARPFLVNDVGERGKFMTAFYIVFAPVVGQFVAGFLTRHALLNPLVAAAMLLPSVAGAVERQGWVSYFLHPLVAYFGQP